MKRIIVVLITLALSVSFFISCNKSDTTVSPEPAGKGALIGKVHSRTEFTDINSTDTLDYANFLVSIDGTSHNTTTDENGNWFFGDLYEGSYTISFSKTGYSDYKQTNAVVTKNDTADFPIYMYKLTTARMINFNYLLAYSQLKLNYRLTVNVQRDYYVRFFFSLDSNLGNPISNYTYSEADLLFSVPITPMDSSYTVEVTNLYAFWTSGKRIYFYGNVGYKNQYYIDSLSKRRVYNSLSAFPTERFSLVLP